MQFFPHIRVHRSIALIFISFEFNFVAIDVKHTKLIFFLVINDINGLEFKLVFKSILIITALVTVVVVILNFEHLQQL
jgi:hypothetical protein